MELSTRVSVEEDDPETVCSRSRGRSRRVAIDIQKEGWDLVGCGGKQGATPRDSG